VNPAAREAREQRLLVLAPTGKDAALLRAKLLEAGFECDVCADAADLAEEIGRGAGSLLVAEEAIAARMQPLARLIERQPSWSDLPVLIMTREGANSPTVGKALLTLGNVTLLERPIRVSALASAVRTALRARQRQYQARAQLAEREAAAQALKEADRRKDEFIATLAHELRNPLAPLRNALNILHMTEAGGSASQLHQMMERQVLHMVRLVDDLLEVSRITRDKIDLRKVALEINRVVDAAVETSRPAIDAAGHHLAIEPADEALFVEGDAVRLAQVFANLLNNAAKYTDEGGWITIRVEKQDERVAVSVRDTGVGIAPAALPRVFDMFMQGESARARGQGGLGIGLTLARRLVEMHGGEIAARSEGLGCGSEFIVRLPLHVPKRDAAPAATPAPAPPSLTRVLVVDDNRDAANSLGALLRMLGAEVDVVHDGEAALHAFSTQHPEVVLLDLGMPGMDGYEVARRLRQRDDARDVMLIALTGWGQERDRLNSRAAGFDHHLIKPADLHALQSLLASAVARPAHGR
jgi:signal transduction histidine kinase/ActR/RegA family two-component response regulator